MSKLSNHFKCCLIISLLHTSSAAGEPIVAFATGSCQVRLTQPDGRAIQTTSEIYDSISTVCQPEVDIQIKAYHTSKDEIQISLSQSLQVIRLGDDVSSGVLNREIFAQSDIIQISVMPIP
jgi:hypothetical protein